MQLLPCAGTTAGKTVAASAIWAFRATTNIWCQTSRPVLIELREADLWPASRTQLFSLPQLLILQTMTAFE